jgi:hypothetical protein
MDGRIERRVASVEEFRFLPVGIQKYITRAPKRFLPEPSRIVGPRRSCENQDGTE